MKKFLLAAALILVSSSMVYAGCVQTFGVGSKAAAQAEAVSAYADDPFAVYYNPAGLTLIEKPMVSGGLTVIDAVAEVTDFKINTPMGDINQHPIYGSGVSDFDSNGDLLNVPHVGFAMPLNDKMWLGVAAYVPYGFNVKWDSNPREIPGALYSFTDIYTRLAVSPTVAYKVNDKLSFGFGVSLGKSVMEAARSYPNALGGDRTYNEYKMEMEDDFNYSFNFGVMYRPIDSISLGLTYRGRTETDFEGDVLFNGGDDGARVTCDYDHPENIQGGIRYFATENLSFEVDLTWTRWSINESQVEVFNPFLHPTTGQVLDMEYVVTYPRDWDDTIQFKIGMDWRALDNFSLRAGYCYDPTPVPGETFDLGWPDTDRSCFDLGFGWNITDRLTLDGVIQHVVSTPVRSVYGSTNLNHVYGSLIEGVTGGAITEDQVSVDLDMKGVMWGYGLTLSYVF